MAMSDGPAPNKDPVSLPLVPVPEGYVPEAAKPAEESHSKYTPRRLPYGATILGALALGIGGLGLGHYFAKSAAEQAASQARAEMQKSYDITVGGLQAKLDELSAKVKQYETPAPAETAAKAEPAQQPAAAPDLAKIYGKKAAEIAQQEPTPATPVVYTPEPKTEAPAATPTIAKEPTPVAPVQEIPGIPTEQKPLDVLASQGQPAPAQAPAADVRSLSYFQAVNYSADRASERAVAYWKEGKLLQATKWAEKSQDADLKKAVWLARSYERVDELETRMPSDKSLQKLAVAIDTYASMSNGTIPEDLKTKLNEKVSQNLDTVIEAARNGKPDSFFVRWVLGLSENRKATNLDYTTRAIEDVVSSETKKDVTYGCQKQQVLDRAKAAGADVSDVKKPTTAFSHDFASAATLAKIYEARKAADEFGDRVAAPKIGKHQKKVDSIEAEIQKVREAYAASESAAQKEKLAKSMKKLNEKQREHLLRMEAANPVSDKFADQIAAEKAHINESEAMREVARAERTVAESKDAVAKNAPGAEGSESGKGSFGRESARKTALKNYHSMAHDLQISDNGKEPYKANVRASMAQVKDGVIVQLGNASEEAVAKSRGYTSDQLGQRVDAAQSSRDIDSLIRGLEDADRYNPFSRRYQAEITKLQAKRQEALQKEGKEYVVASPQKFITAEEAGAQLGVKEVFHNPEQGKAAKFFDNLIASPSVPLPSIFLFDSIARIVLDPHTPGYWHSAKLEDIALNYNQYESHMKAMARDGSDRMYLLMMTDKNGAFQGVALSTQPVAEVGGRIFGLEDNEAVTARGARVSSHLMTKREAMELLTNLEMSNLKMQKQAFDLDGDGDVDVFLMGEEKFSCEQGYEVAPKENNKAALRAIGMTLFTQAKNALAIYSMSNNGGKSGGNDSSSRGSNSGGQNPAHGGGGGPLVNPGNNPVVPVNPVHGGGGGVLIVP